MVYKQQTCILIRYCKCISAIVSIQLYFVFIFMMIKSTQNRTRLAHGTEPHRALTYGCVSLNPLPSHLDPLYFLFPQHSSLLTHQYFFHHLAFSHATRRSFPLCTSVVVAQSPVGPIFFFPSSLKGMGRLLAICISFPF